MKPLLDLVRDRRLYQGALPVTIVMLALVNAAVWVQHGRLEDARRENLLVTGTTQSARYDPSVGEHLDVYFEKIPDARQTSLVVLAGMSQMYAINDRAPGDQIIAEWLDDALAPHGTRVFGLAAPNLSNEEAVLYLLATAASPETRPAAFVYAICFDKLRNVDLRSSLKAFLVSRPAAKEAWRNACGDGLALRYPMACEKMKATLASTEAPAEKVQASASETIEQSVRSMAANLLPLIEDRQNLNAVFLRRVFMLRNRVLNITATTKRPIIQSRYELNQQFIQLIVELAERAKLKLFFYVIPLNPRSENPYIPEQYAAFKSWVEDLARTRSVPFVNLEGVVPASEWGSNSEGPDFKHFKGAGHRITAAAIMEAFGPALRNLGRHPVAREVGSP